MSFFDCLKCCFGSSKKSTQTVYEEVRLGESFNASDSEEQNSVEDNFPVKAYLGLIQKINQFGSQCIPCEGQFTLDPGRSQNENLYLEGNLGSYLSLKVNGDNTMTLQGRVIIKEFSENEDMGSIDKIVTLSLVTLKGVAGGRATVPNQSQTGVQYQFDAKNFLGLSVGDTGGVTVIFIPKEPQNFRSLFTRNLKTL